MNKPSPQIHLFRLMGILVSGFLMFVAIKSFVVPPSWNYTDWYRGQALVDLQRQSTKLEGNESCLTCHKDQYDELMAGAHQSQSCESCHGAIINHVKDNQKVAAAVINKANEYCLNCHQWLPSRPAEFKQIDISAIKTAVKMNKSFAGPEKHKKLVDDTVQCVRCHDFHDPGA